MPSYIEEKIKWKRKWKRKLEEIIKESYIAGWNKLSNDAMKVRVARLSEKSTKDQQLRHGNPIGEVE